MIRTERLTKAKSPGGLNLPVEMNRQVKKPSRRRVKTRAKIPPHLRLKCMAVAATSRAAPKTRPITREAVLPALACPMMPPIKIKTA